MTGNSHRYASWLPHKHTHTLAAACQSSNVSQQPRVCEANAERSIVCCGAMPYLPVLFKACQHHGSGLALQWNGKENQINLSLLTVAGFDPIWGLATQSILFAVLKEKARGGRSSNGLAWEAPLTKKRVGGGAQAKLFCFETVQDRAVTQCFYRAAHLFFAGVMVQSEGRENKWQLEIEFYCATLVCKNESILILLEPFSAQTTSLHLTLFYFF